MTAALEVYVRLELWEEVIKCYTLLEKPDKVGDFSLVFIAGFSSYFQEFVSYHYIFLVKKKKKKNYFSTNSKRCAY